MRYDEKTKTLDLVIIAIFLTKKYFDANIASKKFKYNFYPEKNNHKTINEWIEKGHFYENDVGLFLTRIIRSKDTCVDIGANIGMHSLLMSSLVGPKGKVIAFEPEKVSSEELRANVKLNNFRNIN